MKMRQWLLVAALPLWFGCKSAAPPAESGRVPARHFEVIPAEGSQGHSPSQVHSNPSPYLRIARPHTNVTELQVAVRQFIPQARSQPVIWLAGVSHVGESNYYARLQKLLDAQELVLFEGVTDRASRAAGRKAFERSDEELGSLQNTMAESLGLAFQLDTIDYERPNFRNSDLTIEQIAQLITKEGPAGQPSKTAQEFQKLLELMEGDSLVGALVTAGMKLIGSSPKLQAMMKLVMIEILGRFKGDMSQFQGLPPEWQRLIEILLRARNDAVLKDVRAEIGKRSPAKTIAIFYGAAHMEDLEGRLVREMNYRPAREEWFPAFSVDLKKFQVTDAELGFVKSFVDWQMQVLEQKQH
jgi:hypothetical protein